MKTSFAIILTFFSLNVLAANKDIVINQQCSEGIASYLNINPIFTDDKGSLLRGFGANWNEDQYLNRSGTVSVLFSSENVIYFYNESSDVGGEVYRCDTHNGTISVPVDGYSHYPSCGNINAALASEVNRGSVFYDYCSEHPQE
jgi:hypothetical protein